jgi:hypothetical protein
MAVNQKRIFIAKESFATIDADGNPLVVKNGQRIREGHPLLKGREELFQLDNGVLEVPAAEE